MPRPFVPLFSRGTFSRPTGGGYPAPPAPSAYDLGQVPMPQTPGILQPGQSIIPTSERRQQYRQDLRERRTSSSANFLQSVANNNAEKAVDQQQTANFVTAKRAGIASALAGKTATSIIPPANAQAVSPAPQPGSAKMKITTGTPGTPDFPGEDPRDYIDSEMQREQNVASQQSRGLGLSVQDGGAFRLRPIIPAQLGTKPTSETFRRSVAAPSGAYGLNQEQLDQVNRDASQTAYATAQNEKANLVIGSPQMAPLDPIVGAKTQVMASEAEMNRARAGMYTDQGKAAITRSIIPPASPAAKAMQAPPAAIIEHLPYDQQEQAASDVMGQWRSTTQPSQPTTQPSTERAPKPISPAAAKYFLQQAGGDKEKAREFARSNGYAF